VVVDLAVRPLGPATDGPADSRLFLASSRRTMGGMKAVALLGTLLAGRLLTGCDSDVEVTEPAGTTTTSSTGTGMTSDTSSTTTSDGGAGGAGGALGGAGGSGAAAGSGGSALLDCTGDESRDVGDCAQCGLIEHCNDGVWDPAVCEGQGDCEVGDTDQSDCESCGERVCEAGCTWSVSCQLDPGMQCFWESGMHWQYCGGDQSHWQFCLSSCLWGECVPM
jgi:hypothetical protein